MGKKPSHWYEQSAIIPWRLAENGVELLLITTRKGHWTIPKGIVEADLGARASAMKEALEEAGVSGDLDAEEVGDYRYRKWGGVCHVRVFSLRVTQEYEDFEEMHFRQREWLPLDQALHRLAYSPAHPVLRAFRPRNVEQKKGAR
ncbi:MAG TPA: NUDIX hydrolase [Bacteroidota bacterium]|nr:NUDIX hydrolase [Bacteroidota bacterium]